MYLKTVRFQNSYSTEDLTALVSDFNFHILQRGQTKIVQNILKILQKVQKPSFIQKIHSVEV